MLLRRQSCFQRHDNLYIFSWVCVSTFENILSMYEIWGYRLSSCVMCLADPICKLWKVNIPLHKSMVDDDIILVDLLKNVIPKIMLGWIWYDCSCMRVNFHPSRYWQKGNQIHLPTFFQFGHDIHMQSCLLMTFFDVMLFCIIFFPLTKCASTHQMQKKK